MATKPMVAQYGFSEHRAADYVEFMVTPPPLGSPVKAYFFLMRVWVSSVLALVAALIAGIFVNASWPVIALVFFGGTWLLCRFFGKGARGPYPTTRIRVLEAGLRLLRDGGAPEDISFERKHISDFRVEDPNAAGSRVNASDASAGSAIGGALVERVRGRACSIHMAYGTEDITLVDALPRQVALKLADRIECTFAGS